MATVIGISNSTQITNFLGAFRRLYPVTQASGGTQGALSLGVGRTIAAHTAESTVFQGMGRSAITDKPAFYFALINGATKWVEIVDAEDIRVTPWTSKDEVGLGICSGTCKDDAAAALNDATVTITKGAVSKSATSAAGVYSIADIPADSGYTLTVEKTGYTTASYTVEITENATTTQNVVAARNGSIAGTVTDETGNVEGATVNVCAIDTTTPVLYTAETIADGTYAIASVAVDTYDVWFVKAGTHVGAKTDDQAVVANTAKTVDKVLAQYGSMTGTVTSAGPVNEENVVVSLYAAYPGTPAYTATTAADGTYTIATPILPGTYQIVFTKALYTTAFQMNYVVAADGDYTVNQVIVVA